MGVNSLHRLTSDFDRAKITDVYKADKRRRDKPFRELLAILKTQAQNDPISWVLVRLAGLLMAVNVVSQMWIALR